MAKRSGQLPSVLKSLEADELECIKDEAARLGISLTKFVVHAMAQGEGYIEGILKEFVHKYRGPASAPGSETQNRNRE